MDKMIEELDNKIVAKDDRIEKLERGIQEVIAYYEKSPRHALPNDMYNILKKSPNETEL